ncbi:class II fructose-bisphosphate aldolase [bacterium]|nr:class II fructose-bisphosphate aldolase [bacterium]
MEKLLAMRPENALKVMGENSKVLMMNSKHIFDAILDEKILIMVCNARIPFVVPGIMRAAQELDAIVGYELAKTEGNIDGGYTAQPPKKYVDTIVGYAEDIGFSMPFFVHGDHTTVKAKTDEEVDSSAALLQAEYDAGYTSFAIDASHVELPYNIGATIYLATPIMKWGLGLEVEVGEIAGAAGKLTELSEAMTFIEALRMAKIHPNLLAISNGSKHGNYKSGEAVHIDLKRTGEIAEAIRKYNITIAQHGITGTPLHLMGQFADYGIRKGNVGTIWQNIAHKHLPTDLFDAMKKWSDENNRPIKHATRQFKSEIDSIPDKNKTEIADEAYMVAKEFIEAFRAVGSASLVAEKLAVE